MSATAGAMGAVTAVAPVTRRVRAYFAPVNRAAGLPTLFDPAQQGGFAMDAPPAPWVDLGWISKFARKCGTKVSAMRSGSPAIAVGQVRSEVEATVSFEFEIWGKLQGALASGSQQTNLLKTVAGAALNGSGGAAEAAVPMLETGSVSTATSLNVGPNFSAGFSVGEIVAVDVDYTGQIGYVGSGISGAYVQSAATISGDINYIRRVTLNVGVVTNIQGGVLELGGALPAGVPSDGMKVSGLLGFCDREGCSFFQEWSALFALEGEQGDRIFYHYPRLQAMQGSEEAIDSIAAPLERVRLAGAYRALPVADANDGEMVLCFRSYLPAAMREV